MIYAKRIVSGLNRFYSGHFQNTPNIKTFFGFAGLKRFNMLHQNAELEPAVQCVESLVSEKNKVHSHCKTGPNSACSYNMLTRVTQY